MHLLSTNYTRIVITSIAFHPLQPKYSATKEFKMYTALRIKTSYCTVKSKSKLKVVPVLN